MASGPRRPVRFGIFEVDVAAGTLRKNGHRVPLQQKPFKLLTALLAAPGEIVTREELHQTLWPDEEFGDLDLRLNQAARKVRDALGDSADSPRWIETIPTIGYKFLGAVSPLPPPVAAESEPRPALRKWGPVAALAVLGLLLGVGGMWVENSPTGGSDVPVYRFTVAPPEGALIRSFELSPDGRHLAFVSQIEDDVRIWVRSFQDDAARLIEETANVDPMGAPFWSPDSRHVGYFADDKLKKVAIDGGPAVALADAPGGRGGTWNEDGTIVFAPFSAGRDAQLYSVPDSGGPLKRVSQGVVNSHRSPFFLPGGQRFLFHYRILFFGGGGEAEIRLGELGKMDAKVVLTDQRLHAAYLPSTTGRDGYLLTVRDRVLMAQQLAAETGELVGDPFPTISGVGDDWSTSRALFSVSPSGVLAYLSEDGPHLARELMWVDRKGERLRSYFERSYPQAVPYLVRIAPDGTRAGVAAAHAPGRGAFVEVVDLADGSNLEISDGLFFDWSPDGKSIAVDIAGRDDRNDRIDRVTLDGSVEPVSLSDEHRGRVRDWSPDGRWLLLEDRDKGRNDRDLLTFDMRSGEIQPFLATQANETAGEFSPKGRFVAYSSDETGNDEVYVVRFPEGDRKRKISFGGGVLPAWRPDGKEIYFVRPDLMIMAADVSLEGGRPTASRPTPLFPMETDPQIAVRDRARYPHLSGRFYEPAPDGSRFLVTRGRVAATPSPVHVVVNWRAELERLAQQNGAAK